MSVESTTNHGANNGTSDSADGGAGHIAANYRRQRTSPGLILREMAALARVLLSKGRDRTSDVYDMLATHNNLGRDTLYLNMGYWANAKSYDEACEALAMLVASRAELAPGMRVLDAGFGFADQDIAWARKLGVEVVGFNVTPSQVEVARARVAAAGLASRIDLRLGSVLETGLPDRSVDAVLAVESAFHFPSREAFFAEAHRVLKPGGRLVLADLATVSGPSTFRSRLTREVSARFWQIPSGNLYGIEPYVARLRDAGFEQPRVEDITGDVFAPFGAYARERKHDADVAARSNPILRAIWGRPSGGSVFHYIVAAARKPLAG